MKQSWIGRSNRQPTTDNELQPIIKRVSINNQSTANQKSNHQHKPLNFKVLPTFQKKTCQE
jgi:hypothetical protein